MNLLTRSQVRVECVNVTLTQFILHVRGFTSRVSPASSHPEREEDGRQNAIAFMAKAPPGQRGTQAFAQQKKDDTHLKKYRRACL
jgi:hypothetical protein